VFVLTPYNIAIQGLLWSLISYYLTVASLDAFVPRFTHPAFTSRSATGRDGSPVTQLTPLPHK
jgi:hypothetical protein